MKRIANEQAKQIFVQKAFDMDIKHVNAKKLTA